MDEDYYQAEAYNPYQGLSYLTRRASKLLTSHMEALFATRAMSFVQYAVLINIHQNSAITASEISQSLCHDTGALTRVIEQMEERGLLTRERDTDDRRRVSMRLTPEGNALLDDLVRLLVTFWNKVLRDFTREEADMMTGFMTRLTEKLAAMPKEQG